MAKPIFTLTGGFKIASLFKLCKVLAVLSHKNISRILETETINSEIQILAARFLAK
jgi:proteasome assembly chaperone (PAC2) family protein